jgi:hypothetical protein
VGGTGQQVRPERHPLRGGDRLRYLHRHPRDRPALQQPGGADGQVVVEDRRDGT